MNYIDWLQKSMLCDHPMSCRCSTCWAPVLLPRVDRGKITSIKEYMQSSNSTEVELASSSSNTENASGQKSYDIGNISYECSICFDTMACCYSILPCADTFCYTCIADWADKHKNCPLCNQEFNINTAIPNRMAEGIIEESLSRGSNPEVLLKWKGRVIEGIKRQKSLSAANKIAGPGREVLEIANANIAEIPAAAMNLVPLPAVVIDNPPVPAPCAALLPAVNIDIVPPQVVEMAIALPDMDTGPVQKRASSRLITVAERKHSDAVLQARASRRLAVAEAAALAGGRGERGIVIDLTED